MKKHKIKEINEIYNKKVENIKAVEIELILKEFKDKKNSFNLEEISKFTEKRIINLLNDLFENKNISQIILNIIIIYIEESKNKIIDVNHINILFVGPSGVGKSTLIMQY